MRVTVDIKRRNITIIKTLKIKLIPTEEQKRLMWKHVGCARWIYNYMIALQEERYKNGEKHLSSFDMMKFITPLKRQEEYAWLNEVSNSTLQKACQDVSVAYDRFFKKKAKHPRFKSRKKVKPNFPVCDAIGKTYFKDGCVNIQKVGKVKYKSNYDMPQGNQQKFSNPRVSYTNGKWILTIGVESENQAKTELHGAMGIDLGVKELAVVAFNGEQITFPNINKSRRVRKLKRKLIHLQRQVARKYRTNKSYEKTRAIKKTEAMIREIYYRLSNIRANYIHQTTHSLVARNPARVVMEDLNVTGMMKNRHFSRAIAEQNLAEFIRQMKYKCEWNGIKFIQVGRFYPSSKTCSCCGEIKKDLKLSDRTYHCPKCGLVIDRDYNAAINLMNYCA